MAPIKCGSCKEYHGTVTEVRACCARATDPPKLAAPNEDLWSSGCVTPADKPLLAALYRATPTRSEQRLATALRRRGIPFRAQEVIDGWIVDLYVPNASLVVEVDGRSHQTRHARDALRDEVMRANHYTVLRVPAWRVFRNIQGVVDDIAREIEAVQQKRAHRRQQAAAERQQKLDTEPSSHRLSECRHGELRLLCPHCRIIDQYVWTERDR